MMKKQKALILILIFASFLQISCSFAQCEGFYPYKTQIQKKKIAICYWGLTRSTKKVYESHYTNLFNVLKKHKIKFDVFMHTWHTKHKQRIWEKELDVGIDYSEYKLLKPS